MRYEDVEVLRTHHAARLLRADNAALVQSTTRRVSGGRYGAIIATRRAPNAAIPSAGPPALVTTERRLRPLA